jgi:hypothetical protein
MSCDKICLPNKYLGKQPPSDSATSYPILIAIEILVHMRSININNFPCLIISPPTVVSKLLYLVSGLQHPSSRERKIKLSIKTRPRYNYTGTKAYLKFQNACSISIQRPPWISPPKFNPCCTGKDNLPLHPGF